MFKFETGPTVLPELLEFSLELQHGVEPVLGHVPLAELVEAALPVLEALALPAPRQPKHPEVVCNHPSEEEVPRCGVKVTRHLQIVYFLLEMSS